MGDHADDRCFTVRSRYRNNRNSGGLPRRVEAVDNRLPDVSWLSARWKMMHANTRSRIDFNNSASRYRLRDIFQDEINSADIQPDDARRAPAEGLDIVVYRVGHING